MRSLPEAGSPMGGVRVKLILGKKVGMTQVFDAQGEAIPVTVIEAGPCYVAQVKTLERDGYDAVQLASALIIARALTGTGLAASTFLTADDRLLNVARAEGLLADNPNWHP